MIFKTSVIYSDRLTLNLSDIGKLLQGETLTIDEALEVSMELPAPQPKKLIIEVNSEDSIHLKFYPVAIPDTT
jgi:hypothetical protein